jgi:Ca-activated chloride channel family protein
MHEKRFVLALMPALMLAGLALTGAALAQAPVTADPNLVYIPVAVAGPKSTYVAGLKKENFKLLEDGIEQTITSFHAEDMPIDVDIVLALGNLQRGRATHDSGKIREAIETFRLTGNPRNKYVVEEMPFGANGIWDAMSRHITRLHEQSSNPRKLLLVLTDGFEASGGDPARTLQEYAKKLSVPIYIVFAAPNGQLSDSLADVGRGNQIFLGGGAGYEDLTKFTGGRLYQAEADTQLRQHLVNLVQEFKGQYVLGFKSTNDAKDDKWRKIEVKMANPPAGLKLGDMKPKVRERYFVAKPKK